MKSARKNIVNKLELRKARTASFVLNNFFFKSCILFKCTCPEIKMWIICNNSNEAIMFGRESFFFFYHDSICFLLFINGRITVDFFPLEESATFNTEYIHFQLNFHSKISTNSKPFRFFIYYYFCTTEKTVKVQKKIVWILGRVSFGRNDESGTVFLCIPYSLFLYTCFVPGNMNWTTKIHQRKYNLTSFS